MMQADYDRQKKRIEQVRTLMTCSIEEAKYERDRAFNFAAKRENEIALYELRLQDMDKLEAELNATKIATVEK